MKSNSFALKNVFVHNTNEDLNELSVEMLATLLALYVDDKVTAIKYLELYLIMYGMLTANNRGNFGESQNIWY